MPKGKRNAQYLHKEPTPAHEEFARYITDTTGIEVDAFSVGLIQRLYPLYLKSPAVRKAKDAERAAREAEKAAREQARRAKAQEKLAKLEEQRQKLLAELGEDAPDSDPVAERGTDSEGIEFDPEPEPDPDDSGDDEAVTEATVDDSDDEEDPWGDPDGDDSDDEEEF